VQIILENVDEIDQRYNGYSTEMKNLVAEVMMLEMDHQIQRTNIKQLLLDKIALAASELYEKTQ
jgi:hypothetical protein